MIAFEGNKASKVFSRTYSSYFWSCNSSISIEARQPWFDSWQGQGIFLFTTTSRMALGPNQPSIQQVLGALSLGHQADHSPPSSAKVKNVWSYTSTPPTSIMACCLIKYRNHIHCMVFS
jgi:hypothetical protein